MLSTFTPQFYGTIPLFVQNTGDETMDTERRKFIGYVSILGVAGLGSISPLGALTFGASEDGVYVDHSHVDDDLFDPDGWL